MNDQNALINAYCEQHGVDPVLVKAICHVESAGNVYAVRYEPHWSYFYHPLSYSQKLGLTLETETQLQKFSWGLMQLMGSVARELGFDDHLTMLWQPDINLGLGIKKLGILTKHFGNLPDVISAYNAGTPRKVSGVYANQHYVDKVNLAIGALIDS